MTEYPETTLPGAPDPSAGRFASRHAALNAGALATVAAGSAIQVALFLHEFGATHRTDGMIAALAVYSLTVVMGQLLRTTAVPLLSGPRPSLAGDAFGWGMAAIATAVAVACAALAAPLADAVAAASTASGRHVADRALLVMAPAIGLQVAGSGLAVRGAVRGRLDGVSVAFIASSLAGVAAFFGLRHSSGVLVLAWANLASGVALAGGLVLLVGLPLRRPVAPRRLLGAVAALLHSLPLPASFVLMYPITLALIPRDHPGQITLFGLAFTAGSYLAGFTGQALSMVDAVALSALDESAGAARRAFVVRSFRYSLILAAPGLGVAAVAGGSIVGALLPGRSAGGGSFGVDAVLLAPWLVATLGVWSTLPAWLSSPRAARGRRLFAAVAVLLLIHVAATLAGRLAWRFDGSVAALAVAPAVFALVAGRQAAPGVGAELLRAGVSFAVAAVACFGVTELVARAVGGGAVAGILAGVAALLLYAGLAARLAPDIARTLARLTLGRGRRAADPELAP